MVIELKTGRPLRLSTAVRLAAAARLPKTRSSPARGCAAQVPVGRVGPDVGHAGARPVDRGRGHDPRAFRSRADAGPKAGDGCAGLVGRVATPTGPRFSRSWWTISRRSNGLNQSISNDAAQSKTNTHSPSEFRPGPALARLLHETSRGRSPAFGRLDRPRTTEFLASQSPAPAEDEAEAGVAGVEVRVARVLHHD